jgi:hypothetical protein
VLDQAQEPAIADASAQPQSRRPALRGWSLVALVSGLVAIVAAVLLPFAPVSVNQPVVQWPQQPTAPEPTHLMLSTYQPLAMDVRFSCAAARRAGATADGVLLATSGPAPGPAAFGLRVTVDDGRLLAQSGTRTLVDEALPSGECSYRIRGAQDGLVVLRDGAQIAAAPAEALPDVDALVTSLTSLPGGRDALNVRITVDDRFAHRPTALKVALLVVVSLAVLTAFVALVALDRRAQRSAPARRRLPRPTAADLVVVVALLGWLFLAPIKGDDGFYSAMAANVPFEGYVGNYYQLYNNSFTPFSWFYVLLSHWQAVGLSPVMLRIPALVFGLLTWLLLRFYVSGLLNQVCRRAAAPWIATRGRWLAYLVLAVTFIAWWAPFNMGVRPEGAVALCAAAALLGVALAVERQRLAVAAAAFFAAGIGLVAHPTGLIALAPLFAGASALWRLVRVDSPLHTAARTAALVAAGTVAAVLGFADGTIRDFLYSQQVFLGIQEQESWYTEYLRYLFLLRQNPMGSYANRAPVLLGLLGLLWFVGLMVAARVRRVDTPLRFSLTGWALAASFLLLWFTPSKWTHHFGALAAVGGAFLALLLLVGPLLVRQVIGAGKIPLPVQLGVAGSAVLTMALAGHGPNYWPYSWMLGLPRPRLPPGNGNLSYDQPLLWVVVLLAALGLVTAWSRWRGTGWRAHRGVLALSVAVLVFFGANLGFLFSSFGIAAVRTWDTWSLWASNLQDPLAANCSAGGAIEVLDERAAVPLTELPAGSVDQSADGGEPATAGFVAGDGWLGTAVPPVPLGSGAMSQAWGTFVRRPGQTPEQTIGTMATPWYALPSVPDGSALTTLVTGRVGNGNTLTAEYGTRVGDRLFVTGRRPLGETLETTVWRTLLLAEPGNVPVGADAVRLVATDSSATIGGWMAFSAPSMQRFVPLREYLPDGEPVAIGWRTAFLFPCLRQPRLQDGITEPVATAVAWGDTGLEALRNDGAWKRRRGGLFAHVPRTASGFQTVARLAEHPAVSETQVYRFTSGLPAGQYELIPGRRTVSGWERLG